MLLLFCLVAAMLQVPVGDLGSSLVADVTITRGNRQYVISNCRLFASAGSFLVILLHNHRFDLLTKR